MTRTLLHGEPAASRTPLAPVLSLTLVALASALLTLGPLSGCASLPEGNAALDAARSRHATLMNTPDAGRYAAQEVDSASAALRLAQAAQADGANRERVDHLAYLATQRVAMAQATVASRAAQAVTAGAGAERDRLRLEVRTAEADQAQRALQASEQASMQASRQAEARASADRAQATSSAEVDRARLAASSDQVNSLRAQLRELQSLNARQTDRGIVVTLGDMLFATGHADLQPGAARSVNQLAEFLLGHPEQRVTIEGHTDSMGSRESNNALSERRAQSVRSVLVGKGVGAERLQATGLGPDSPVASNGNAAGRQQNRRVEVVFVPASPGASSR